jgi:hypothetical protein
METTIELPDSLLDEARVVAEREGLTLRELLERGLRLALAEHTRGQQPGPHDTCVDGDGLTPEFRNAPWAKFRDTIYGLDEC